MSPNKRPYFYLAIILFLGLFLRFASIYPNNVILGFDQARDLFAARRIYAEGDLRIVGPTAGNNAALHHGVAFLYLIVPPIFLGGGNPFWISLWLSLFNLASAFVLYLFAKSLFKSEKAGLIAAFLTAISYYFVQFAGWISNPSPTLLTVPLAFYGLWEYKMGKKWGLPLSLFFLGLSIQLELFFLYLLPVFIFLGFVFRLKVPKLKVISYSLLALSLSLSTMILTEVKFRFAGALSLLGDLVTRSGAKPPFSETLRLFSDRYFETFSLNLLPTHKPVGVVIGSLLLGYLVYAFSKSKRGSHLRSALLLTLVYLLSPILMLVLGFHAAPWVLIGLSPAIIITAAFTLSRLRPELTIIGLFVIIASNFIVLRSSVGRGQPLLGPDASAIVSTQLNAVDYTYQKAAWGPFSINTVTNPLYVNAVWAWNYEWYGKKKYGYLPGWLGGDQEHPYNVLGEHREPKDDGEIFYLITDQSPRIPGIHKDLAQKWAEENGKMIEEKDFGAIKVSMWKKLKPF